jgi:putative ABC transport system ATP-binding protein
VDTSGPAALSLEGVRRTYEAETAPVRALRGVDLEVGRGEFVALMGPSGCGKSTLLHIAAGLDRPDEGSVRLAGQELTTLSEARLSKVRRKDVGMVFQFFHLLEGMSVAENIVLAALVAGASRRDADARAQELLDLLGLLDKARSAPASLSGGQRQRLAIARALANSPTLLLADEPTGALDSETGEAVLRLLRQRCDAGASGVLVTHEARHAGWADRVVFLRDGVVVDETAPTGAPEQLLDAGR